MTERGVTLIELLVAISIILILVVALGFSFIEWQSAYRIESAAKELYTDLVDARARAMTRNMEFFADFNTPAPPPGMGSYRVFGDGNGNGAPNPGAGDPVPQPFPKTVNYVINWNGGGTITFDRRGTITGSGTIRLVPAAGSNPDPDYDCIVIGPAAPATRINLGSWDGANCDQR